jgi:hypothetical protein
MKCSIFWNIVSHGLVISYRCFEAAYYSHLQGSVSLKVGSTGCPKILVTNYQIKLCNTNSIQITKLHYVITKTNPKMRKWNQRVVKTNSCRITVILFQHLQRVNVGKHEKSFKTTDQCPRWI